MLHAKRVQLALRYISVLPTQLHCLSSTGPNSKDPFILDQIRWAPLILFDPHTFCFCLTGQAPFLLHYPSRSVLCHVPQRQKGNRLDSPPVCFTAQEF